VYSEPKTDLLEDEHLVVKELLQLLVGEVDAELLEAVGLEDLKAGNVQQTDKRLGVARTAVERLPPG
jgi:hypothetical protein